MPAARCGNLQRFPSCETNRHLADDIEAGRFCQDLYYRINVMSLELPPIREREGDLPLLVAHFLGPAWEIEEAAMQALDRYHWPGNIRQLLNCIDRGKTRAAFALGIDRRKAYRLVEKYGIKDEEVQSGSNPICSLVNSDERSFE